MVESTIQYFIMDRIDILNQFKMADAINWIIDLPLYFIYCHSKIYRELFKFQYVVDRHSN